MGSCRKCQEGRRKCDFVEGVGCSRCKRLNIACLPGSKRKRGRPTKPISEERALVAPIPVTVSIGDPVRYIVKHALKSVAAQPRSFFEEVLRLPIGESFVSMFMEEDMSFQTLSVVGSSSIPISRSPEEYYGLGLAEFVDPSSMEESLNMMQECIPTLVRMPEGKVCTMYEREVYSIPPISMYSTTMYCVRYEGTIVGVLPVKSYPHALGPCLGDVLGKVPPANGGWKAYMLKESLLRDVGALPSVDEPQPRRLKLDSSSNDLLLWDQNDEFNVLGTDSFWEHNLEDFPGTTDSGTSTF